MVHDSSMSWALRALRLALMVVPLIEPCGTQYLYIPPHKTDILGCVEESVDIPIR